MDCRCLLTKNLFAYSVSRHFDYDGPVAFRLDHHSFLRELGHERAAALLDELEVEARRRARLDLDARARTAEIRARYVHMHPALLQLDAQRWLDPRFLALVDLARERPDAFLGGAHAAGGDERASALGMEVLDALSPVYALPVFTPAFCAALCAELAAFEVSGLPMGRPNSMNRHGVLLAELGLDAMLDELVARYVTPLAAALFADAGGASLDSHRAFTVKYALGGDESLALHFDNAEVTLNCCISEGFEGGELLFGGLHTGGPQTPTLALEHSHGRGILHRGGQMHQALPVASGTRINLVIWCRSERHRREHGCPMCRRTDLLIGADTGADWPAAEAGVPTPEPIIAGAAAAAAWPTDEQIAEFMKG